LSWAIRVLLTSSASSLYRLSGRVSQFFQQQQLHLSSLYTDRSCKLISLRAFEVLFPVEYGRRRDNKFLRRVQGVLHLPDATLRLKPSSLRGLCLMGGCCQYQVARPILTLCLGLGIILLALTGSKPFHLRIQLTLMGFLFLPRGGVLSLHP